jgi:hypothetical protein
MIGRESGPDLGFLFIFTRPKVPCDPVVKGWWLLLGWEKYRFWGFKVVKAGTLTIA